MGKQKIVTATKRYEQLDQYLKENRCRKVMLVCGSSIQYMRIGQYFNTLQEKKGIEVVRFEDFQPNPLYESAVKGVELFRKEACDSIVAVGGGSTIDMGKCIKLYSNMDKEENYLKQTIIPNNIPFLAVPTTGGSGSEATRYAVLYYEGEKQSITHESILPEVVLFDGSTLCSLPEYQRKATMMDAFCHALESFWSVNSTKESTGYSRKAIQLILSNMDGYLKNECEANKAMQIAAYTAGKAINITQTTAGHAMCYKLTSLYGISHGHAAALCNVRLFPFMIEHLDRCIDKRGRMFLGDTLQQIADAMGCGMPEEAAEKFAWILSRLGLSAPEVKDGGYAELVNSVNPVRLKNHPIRLDEESIDTLYHQILNTKIDNRGEPQGAGHES